jgi:UDP-glucose 4-epimerase
MNKILVTGAGGYIGSVTTDLLLSDGFEVVAVDNFSTGFKKPLEYLQNKYGKSKFRFYERDLVEDKLDDIFKDEQIDLVMHFAAFCSVGESVKKPELYFRNNVEGSQNLINTIFESGVRNLVFSSTCAVYGQSEYLPIDENHPRNPLSPYGQSKKQVEDLLFSEKFPGLNYFILRYFNVCGATEDGNLGDAKKPSIHLVQNAVRGALGIEEFKLLYPEVDTPDKSPIRDYVDVLDLAHAHKKAVEALLKNGGREVVNLGAGSGYSVLEIIKEVEAVTGTKIKVQKGETREGDPSRLYADNSKAKQILDWTPKRVLKDSIENLVRWYKAHPHGWED